MNKWAIVAKLTKARNLDGGLFAQSVKGLPFLLEEGMEVTFVPPVLDLPRSSKVSLIKHDVKGMEIHFEDVDTLDKANLLTGHYCLVPRSVLDAVPQASDDVDYIGCQVQTSDGENLGTVQEVEQNPAHPLLVVGNGERTIRVPLVDEFIVEFRQAQGDSAKTLIMQLPAGLTDL